MVDYITETTVSQVVQNYVEENLVYRRPFEQISIADDPTDTYRIAIQTDEMGDIEKVDRGSDIPTTEEGIAQLESSVDKYAKSLIIPDEDQEDSRFDVVQRNVEKMGRRMTEKWNMEAFNALSTNLHPNSPYDQGGSTSGTLDFEDIIQARQILLEEGRSPDYMFVTPQAETDLLLADTGYQRMTELGDEAVVGGEVGEIAGLTLVRDDSGLLTGSSGIMVDSGEFGFEVVKRDVRTDSWREDSKQSDAFSISSRFDHNVYNPNSAIRVDG